MAPKIKQVRHKAKLKVTAPDQVAFENEEEEKEYKELYDKLMRFENIKADNDGKVIGKEAECSKILDPTQVWDSRNLPTKFHNIRKKLLVMSDGKESSNAIFAGFVDDIFEAIHRLPRNVAKDYEKAVLDLELCLQNIINPRDPEEGV